MKNIIFLLTVFLCSVIQGIGQNQKVLVLALDGARADAIQVANTPNIDALMSNGSYSYDAFTKYPTKTKPGWSSLYTGVWKEQHNILSNDALGNNLNRYPYFIKHLKKSNPNLNAVWITGNGQSPLQQHVSQYIDLQVFDYIDDYKKTVAIDLLTNQDPDIMILHFGFIDFHGHVYSFSPNAPEYINAIELADSQVGEVMTALYNRPNYTNEDWLIIGASDHGGNGLNHGGSTIKDRNIIFFVSGDNVVNQQIKAQENSQPLAMAPHLNGTNQFVTLPYNNDYALNQNEDFSIECRVLLTDTTQAQVILSNQDVMTPVTKGFSITINPLISNGLIVNMSDGTTGVVLNGPSIADGIPHHISLTVDRSEFLSLYVDGFMYDAVKIDHLNDVHSANNLVLGQSGTMNHNNYLSGSINEVRIWDCVLSETDIANYACSSPDNSHPNINKLSGYYPMNDGGGATFSNNSVQGALGQMTGGVPVWGPINAKLLCKNYNNTPRIVDGAPTILNHFCIPINPMWEIQGESWANKTCSYQTCPPVAFTGAEDITLNSARLTWSPQTIPHHYVLRGKRPDDKQFKYYTLSDPTDTSFVVTKLKPNTEYIWQIQTVCDTNDLVFSGFSPLDTVVTLDCAEPTELQVDSVSNMGARLSWNQNSQASFYRVHGSGAGFESNAMDFVLTGSHSTTLELNNLDGGTEYYWQVRSECGVGHSSDYSYIDTFTTLNAKDLNPGDGENLLIENDIVIFPNPLEKESNISFFNPDSDDYTLILTNASGAVVRKIDHIKSSYYMLNRNELASGVYFLELKGPTIRKARLVIQ